MRKERPDGRNRVAVGISVGHRPRVARASQPWALSLNPFGIGKQVLARRGSHLAEGEVLMRGGESFWGLRSLVSAVEGLPEIAEVAGVDEVGALVLAAVTPDVEATEIGAAEQGIIGF